MCSWPTWSSNFYLLLGVKRKKIAPKKSQGVIFLASAVSFCRQFWCMSSVLTHAVAKSSVLNGNVLFLSSSGSDEGIRNSFS